MNPTSKEIFNLILSNQLGDALRGDVCVFSTPSHINDDMQPTDHNELLDRCIYPLVQQHGVDFIRSSLECAIKDICSDALGVFCAHQCFYIEIIKEHAKESPIFLERENLPKILAKSFLNESVALHNLEIRKGDLANDRSYKVILSGMRILERDYGIDWGISLQKL
jgi:hypothetical protein